MRLRYWIALVCFPLGATAGPSVLNGGTHAATFIAPAVNAALGAGHVDTDIFVDRTADPAPNIVTQSSVTAGTPNFSVASSTADNHAIYGVINLSYAGYTLALDENTYTTLVPQGTVYSSPFARATQSTNTPPPSGALVVTSSPNSGNGGTGPGIEFALSASYKGLDTTADSWVSAEMAGFLAALKFNHSSWNWNDVKAVMRVTAANWATGYDRTNYGYGAINFDSATAYAGTIYLQPPVITAMLVNNNTIQVTVYPFRQTRRHHEVIYIVPAGYNWPIKNEYVLSDITASGGTLVFTGNNTDVLPSGTISGLSPGTYNLIGFTTDNAGAYSRVESYSGVITPSISCL